AEEYNLQSELITRLRKRLVIETDEATKFKLEIDIAAAEKELAKLDTRLSRLERHPEQAQPPESPFAKGDLTAKAQPPKSPFAKGDSMTDQPERRYNLAQINRLLDQAFDDTGLQNFCQIYFETVHNSFGVGQNKTQRIMALIDHCRRFMQFDKLLVLLQEENPAQYARFGPYVLS
ncbi:MAG: hypothetical protein GY869_06925, partial [Planctomycetes bacterium]|nr:hypothetical protein [Planctomycetota bacterium]